MSRNQVIVISAFLALLMLGFSLPADAREINVNARSAMLVDMTNGQVLYEQNADIPIAPASITKVLTLYLVFEAIRDGRLHLWDNVRVSARAAKTGGSRMGLRTGDIVPVGELVKGMAVVSGNDACVAIAEHMSGSVEAFVRQMNIKARQLGMNDSTFHTPNGLPAKGQLTTARDIARLAVAYLRRYPESLNIHSMQSYTYRTSTHRNANRLLGTCQGVDGLKTGFVCAAGYNLAATAIRGDHRLIAVVLGAPSAGVRATETARLLEMGYESLNTGTILVRALNEPSPSSPASRGSSRSGVKSSKSRGKSKPTVVTDAPTSIAAQTRATRTANARTATPTAGSDSTRESTARLKSSKVKGSKGSKAAGPSQTASRKSKGAKSVEPSSRSKEAPAGQAQLATRSSGDAGKSGDAKAATAKPKKGSKSEQAAEVKKSASTGTSGSSAPTQKQKTSSPQPSIRKINPAQKSPTSGGEARKSSS